MIALKEFQEQAVERGRQVFNYLRGLLDRAGLDAASRATAVACHGYILIEAPTGAGKTLIAGSLAERFSGDERVVWFWFAPFGGLVEQTRNSLRERFAGLHVRDLRNDRFPDQSNSGDVFVTTWASVATANRDGRRIRQSSERQLSADDFIPALRECGFRIGVVVDEAHHGFRRHTQAVAFFKQVLQPEYTVLVTATPDDQDIKAFRNEMQARTVCRIGISRDDAVGSGLIKRGLRAIAYLAPEENRELIDYERTALAEGVRIHRNIDALLQRSRIALKPLMLVQVDSRTKTSVERARRELQALGLAESAIAVHTANEPDDNLMALANDETKEALIFKMAVALGFDAPRAFTLVSMRGSRDADFGVQVVGRILRVHRRLQGRKGLPDALAYGYAVFADSASQSGLLSAAGKINAIRTGIQEFAPAAVLVQMGQGPMVQLLNNGQTSLIPGPEDQVSPMDFDRFRSVEDGARCYVPANQSDSRQPTLLGMSATGPADARAPSAAISAGMPASAGMTAHMFSYPLREGMPRVFRTEELPATMDGLAHDLQATVRFDRELLLAGQRDSVRITRLDIEAFTQAVEKQTIVAALSPEDVRRRAQALLFRLDYLDAKEIRAALLERLRQEYDAAGLSQVASDPLKVRNALDLILAHRPELIQETARECLARHTEVRDTAELPPALVVDVALRQSEKNVYGVFPPGMNSWETAFAELLDTDDGGRVLWWHRNEPTKPWSVKTILASGKGFYPDFIVGLRDRKLGGGVLLMETKFHFEDALGIEKVNAEHRVYRRALVLCYEDERRWMSVRYDPEKHKNALDRVFDLTWAAAFI